MSVAPTPGYDESGTRVMPPYPETAIGDIEVKESRSNTLSLLQQFYVGINRIIEFFMAPGSRPTSPAVRGNSPAVGTRNSPAVGTRNSPAVGTNDAPAASAAQNAGLSPLQGAEDPAFDISISEFTILIYRYLIGLFDCSELFIVDENRSKEMVRVRGRCEV